MDWSDEHYVKLFTRDTVTWRSWPWQARALLALLLRKVDNAGFFDVGRREPALALAIMVEMPHEVVAPGLEALLADGTIELIDGRLLLPNFVDAQESKKTDKAKARDYRNRKKDHARANIPNPQDSTVTARHRPSPPVTAGDPPALPVPCPSPALPVVRTSPVPVVVVPPDTPPDSWQGDDFWRWAQSKRQAAKLIAEKPPDSRRLSAWFSSALQTLNGDVKRLCEAFLNFGDDKHWQTATPPLPFGAFMSQWDRYVPRGSHAA